MSRALLVSLILTVFGYLAVALDKRESAIVCFVGASVIFALSDRAELLGERSGK